MAAKEALISEVASLQATQRVVLFAFNSESTLAFDGTASDLTGLKSALDALEPANGTDLAAALRVVQKHLADHREPHVAVELISDGLSKIDAARDAAQDLARIVTLIEVLLIDPTEEGLAVANAVVQRGKVTQVISEQGLTVEVGEAANRQSAEHDRVTHALAKAAEERATTVGSVSQAERLSITVGYPGSPVIDVWQGLVAYLHLPNSRNEVNKRLTAQARSAGQRLAESSSHITAMRGTWFTLIPRLEGVSFNPPQQEVAWLEDVQEVPFRFRVSAEFDGKPIVGGVEVLAKGVCVAVVPIALTAGGNTWADSNDPWETSSGSMFEEVFASYSRKDLKIVDACAAAYKALGVHLFVDRRDLLGGQEWHPALLRKIEQADAFQLFWSTASRVSPNVENEWKHAMAYRSQKGHRFLRPLYWEEPKPEAPAELNRLNFAFLDLNALGSRQTSEASSKPDTQPAGEPVLKTPSSDTAEERGELLSASLELRAKSINAPVMPLLAGESRQSLSAVRGDVSRAVAFLEDLSGLRYYPAATLIVDDFVVRHSREACRLVDEFPEEPNSNEVIDEAEMWTDVISAMLLQFHVRKVPPLAGSSLNEIENAPRSTIPAPALEGLRQFAEWGIARWMWGYRFFPWEEEHNAPANPKGSERMSEKVVGALDKLITLLQGKTVREKQHEFSFSRPTSSDPSEFDDRIAWEAVSQNLINLGLQTNRRVCTFTPPVDQEDSWAHEVSGSTSTVVGVLVHIREELATRLPKYDDLDYSAAKGPDASGMVCIGLAVVAAKIADKLNWELSETERIWGRWVDDWVIEVLHPSWRRVRDWMAAAERRQRIPRGPDWVEASPLPGISANQNFREFLKAYLDVMKAVFQEGLARSPHFPWSQGNYGISEKAWKVIQQQDAELGIALTRSESWGQVIGGSFDSFVELFQRTARRLLSLLSEVPPRHKRATVLRQTAQVVTESSVFGVFIPTGASGADSQLLSWAVQNGLMQQAVLPETNRVLYCTHASEGEVDSGGTVEVQRILRQCTLLHEHFHALMETGVSADGQLARGPADKPAWSGATGLNESLAVLIELHFLRQHGHLIGSADDVKTAFNSLWAYIRCGEYPAWPYRGAEKLEELYLQHGIAAVRSLMSRLRDDPVGAQCELDNMELESSNDLAGSGSPKKKRKHNAGNSKRRKNDS